MIKFYILRSTGI